MSLPFPRQVPHLGRLSYICKAPLAIDFSAEFLREHSRVEHSRIKAFTKSSQMLEFGECQAKASQQHQKIAYLDMKIKNIQTRHERGNSRKGEEQLLNILSASRSVLIDVGYSSFTMRKIAEKARMSLGNLSYYYKSKQAILSDLLDAVMDNYQEILDEIVYDPKLSDKEKLKKTIKTIILDLGRKETTHFFPELWALANHNKEAATGMDLLYQRERKIFDLLISRLNPDLSSEHCGLLSLFISTSLEGQTMFVGYKKPSAEQREALAELASDILLKMVLEAKPSAKTNSLTQQPNALAAPAAALAASVAPAASCTAASRTVGQNESLICQIK